MEMLRTGALDAGLLTGTMFFACLRPSEALALVVIFPLGNERPGKTGAFDHSVQPVLEQHPSLAQALKLWVAGRLPGELLFSLTYETFLGLFKAAAARGRSEALGPTPYGLRLGSASHDQAPRLRSLAGIQRRALWRSWACGRRHEKSEQTAAAAACSSRQQQPAAASRQQQPPAAAASSSRQQQPAAACSSRQQQPPPAAASSSRQQQPSAAASDGSCSGSRPTYFCSSSSSRAAWAAAACVPARGAA